MRVKTVGDVLAGREKCAVHCLYSRKHVRTIEVRGLDVVITPTDGTPAVRLDPDTPVRHEPWVMDRGNLLFPGDATGRPEFAGAELKLCGVDDVVKFDDGTSDRAEPGD